MFHELYKHRVGFGLVAASAVLMLIAPSWLKILFLTVGIVLGFAWAVIAFVPAGWRTRFFHWASLMVPGIPALIEAFGGVDWSKLIDQPKVAYGLAVGIPIAGLWLRELTRHPPG